eukprot:4292388-Amphidinium_carterae.1
MAVPSGGSKPGISLLPLPTKPGVQTHAMHVELRSKLDAAQAIDMLNDFVLQEIAGGRLKP